ncbi:HAD family hydrolase [Enterococcus sp. 669A]|uniref:HAD family hydrolase n=1 Tax=Candidatus Enterococcus moelleringii TaxID=2815325 RepID=A0ABS3L9U0_9ENTE|nr:HAD family hydrolase [Enterococcus sp. 669A]MBO1306399.1 HAD family hydrolase [Enterococcus sp. 669A]
MLEAIIFDMDGVLVDSEYTYFESKSAILKEAGHPVEESYHYQFMGTTGEFMWQKMKEEFDLSLSVEEYVKKMVQMREVMVEKDGVRPIEGAPAFVKRLYEAGLPLGVASSSTLKEIKSNLKALGIAECFQVVMSSEEVPNSKPAPDVYLEVARRLGVEPVNCLGIEDTKNGSTSVNRAGMVCVGFHNPIYPKQDLQKADRIVESFDALDREALAKIQQEVRDEQDAASSH